jgi:hypothetical protein
VRAAIAMGIRSYDPGCRNERLSLAASVRIRGNWPYSYFFVPLIGEKKYFLLQSIISIFIEYQTNPDKRNMTARAFPSVSARFIVYYRV